VPNRIPDTEDSLQLNENLHTPNGSKDDCLVDRESDVAQDNHMEDPEFPEQRYVSAMPLVLRFV
jgi:hypothetical protein